MSLLKPGKVWFLLLLIFVPFCLLLCAKRRACVLTGVKKWKAEGCRAQKVRHCSNSPRRPLHAATQRARAKFAHPCIRTHREGRALGWKTSHVSSSPGGKSSWGEREELQELQASGPCRREARAWGRDRGQSRRRVKPHSISWPCCTLHRDFWPPDSPCPSPQSLRPCMSHRPSQWGYFHRDCIWTSLPRLYQAFVLGSFSDLSLWAQY